MKKLLTIVMLLAVCGAAWGIHGSSLWFNGTSSHVHLGNPASIKPTDVISGEAWFYRTGSKDYESIIANNNAGGYFLRELVSSYITVVFNTSTSCGGNFAPAFNSWHYVCFTWDGSKIRLFGDGVKTDSTVFAGPISYTGVVEYDIGEDRGTNYWRGLLDEIRIYHRALSPTEIAWNYRHPSQPYSRDSLKLWLQMNEYTGVTTVDSSGQGNNGTISGATWNIETPVYATKATHGSSLWFDGVSSIVTVPDANSLDLAVPFTVESWFNIKFKSWGTLLAKSRSSGTTALWNYGVISYADKHIYFAVGNGVASSDGISITSLRDDLWYHAVFTVSSDSVRAYIQGAKTGAVVRTVTPFTDTSSLKIGYAALTPNGNMDEIRLYSRALSATEVAWNYRYPSQPYDRTGLVGWWQFNEFTGVTAYDSSGLANNGTISGALWSIETP